MKIIVSVLVLIMLIKRLQMKEILAAFQSARLFCIYMALALLIPNIYAQYLKWRYLVRLVKPDVPDREVIQSLLAGLTFGFITPGRVGEFGRAFFISNCSWVKLLGITFIDKLFAMAVVFFWGAIGLLYFISRQLYIYTMVPVILFTLIALVVIYYIIFHPEIIKSFLYSLNIILPFRDKIKLLMSSLDNFHRRQAIILALLNFSFYAIFFIQYYILVCAFEPAPIVQSSLAIFSTMLVKSMLPISVGDLGVRESAAVFFFSKIGVLHSTAFNASILLFMINLLLPSLAGLFLVLRYGLVFKKNNRTQNNTDAPER